jgi:hypothetical protein
MHCDRNSVAIITATCIFFNRIYSEFPEIKPLLRFQEYAGGIVQLLRLVFL